MVSPSGENYASPDVGLSLGENSASPELDFGQLPRQELPTNPAGVYFDNCTNPSLHNCMPRAGSTKASGDTSVSPKPGLGLDNIDQRTSPFLRKGY
jgi:hypothetical protein